MTAERVSTAPLVRGVVSYAARLACTYLYVIHQLSRQCAAELRAARHNAAQHPSARRSSARHGATRHTPQCGVRALSVNVSDGGLNVAAPEVPHLQRGVIGAGDHPRLVLVVTIQDVVVSAQRLACYVALSVLTGGTHFHDSCCTSVCGSHTPISPSHVATAASGGA